MTDQSTSVCSAAITPFGQLAITLTDGTEYLGVEVVQAFPISAPGESLSIVDGNGQEVVTVKDWTGFPASCRGIIQDFAASRNFLPEIVEITVTSAPAPPCVWDVTTDCGQTKVSLESEDDVRRIGPQRLQVTDANGVRYGINLDGLKGSSRAILRRFL